LQPRPRIPARLLPQPRGGGARAVPMACGVRAQLDSPNVGGARMQAEQVEQAGARDSSCLSAGDDDT
jgi:hypothetical protein